MAFSSFACLNLYAIPPWAQTYMASLPHLPISGSYLSRFSINISALKWAELCPYDPIRFFSLYIFAESRQLVHVKSQSKQLTSEAYSAVSTCFAAPLRCTVRATAFSISLHWLRAAAASNCLCTATTDQFNQSLRFWRYSVSQSSLLPPQYHLTSGRWLS